MKRIAVLALVLGVAFVSVGTQLNANENSDDVLKLKIIGSWAESERPSTETIYEKGGKYTGKIWQTPDKILLLLLAEGKWWIENGRLYNTVHKVVPSQIPVTEKPIVDIIVSITDTTMTLIDEEGKKFEKIRIK